MNDSAARRELKDKVLAEGDGEATATTGSLEEAVRIAASREQEVKGDNLV